MKITFNSPEEAKQVRDQVKDILLALDKNSLKNDTPLNLLDNIYTQSAKAGDSKS